MLVRRSRGKADFYGGVLDAKFVFQFSFNIFYCTNILLKVVVFYNYVAA